MAADFIAARRRQLESERNELSGWLEQRCREITADAAPAEQTGSLFEAVAPGTASPARGACWRRLDDAAAKLAAFASDGSQPPGSRSAADGVLRIYRQRLEGLEARLAMRAPEVVPLGILMLVPKD
jgi:hypothetical protein